MSVIRNENTERKLEKSVTEFIAQTNANLIRIFIVFMFLIAFNRN